MSNDASPIDPVSALSALAHEQRLAVFRLLVKAGPDGMPAGQIAEVCGSPASSMSFHLAHLTRSGLITQRRESRSLIYAAHYQSLQGLIEFLIEDCCGGRAEICVPLADFAKSVACCDEPKAGRA